jgi:hypothetical protein
MQTAHSSIRLYGDSTDLNTPTTPISYKMFLCIYQKNIQMCNSVALVRKRIIPTERPPLVSEVKLLRIEDVAWSAQRIPTAVNLGFLDWSRYFSTQVAPWLSSQGWVDPMQEQLLLRKPGSAGNQTRDLCICSQELWPLDHRDRLSDIIREIKATRMIWAVHVARMEQ